MKVQIVHATVAEESRERYLEAWAEWSGTLLPMGIETELLERDDEPGRFVEITWFEEGEEAAAGDDRLARASAEMEAAAEEREGEHRYLRPPEVPGQEGWAARGSAEPSSPRR